MGGTSSRVVCYASIEDKRVREESVVACRPLVARGGHILQIGCPGQSGIFHSIDNAGIGCRAKSYRATVVPTEVIVTTRPAHVIWKNRMVTCCILTRCRGVSGKMIQV